MKKENQKIYRSIYISGCEHLTFCFFWLLFDFHNLKNPLNKKKCCYHQSAITFKFKSSAERGAMHTSGVLGSNPGRNLLHVFVVTLASL